LLCTWLGQFVPPANSPPVNVASLPNAPLFGDLNSARSGAKGAPEYCNAVPQVKQSMEDQSDDQESPAVFLKHLIDDRFLISGQSNFIFQAHTPFHSPYSGPNSFRSFVNNPGFQPRSRAGGCSRRPGSSGFLSLASPESAGAAENAK
jgi:hypothetical protein